MNEIQPKRYVAFFDMLGCAEATLKNVDGTKEALYVLREQLEKVLSFEIDIPRFNLYLTPQLHVAAVNFSDSILLFTFGDSIEDLHLILILSAEIFAKSLHKCVPLRGGIAYGDFYFDLKKSLFCGIPLVEAHKISERAQWSGIVISDGIAEQYKQIPLLSHNEYAIMKWSVPIKDSNNGKVKKQEQWVLKWPLIHRNNFNVEAPISPELWSKAFNWLFKGSYTIWPKDIQDKYNNTFDFINEIINPKPK